jgi:uncharacterized membrane protein
MPIWRPRSGRTPSARRRKDSPASSAHPSISSALVVAWIAVNAAAATLRWDPYPFILLNLAFSTQAAYAAPLILLAQTRQAERDKAWSDADVQHREELQNQILSLLQQNTDLTEEVARLSTHVRDLTEEIHARLFGQPSDHPH